MEGVRYVSSEPEATKTGNTLTWAWEQLHGGDTKTITVTVVPEKEGDLKELHPDPVGSNVVLDGRSLVRPS